MTPVCTAYVVVRNPRAVGPYDAAEALACAIHGAPTHPGGWAGETPVVGAYELRGSIRPIRLSPPSRNVRLMRAALRRARKEAI